MSISCRRNCSQFLQPISCRRAGGERKKPGLLEKMRLMLLKQKIRFPLSCKQMMLTSKQNRQASNRPLRRGSKINNDLLAVKGTLKSLLQLRSSKASIIWHSAFFMVQLSHPYVTTQKTIALTRQPFLT